MARIHNFSQHVLPAISRLDFTSVGSGSVIDTRGYTNVGIQVVASTKPGSGGYANLYESNDLLTWAFVGSAWSFPNATSANTGYYATCDVNTKNRRRYLMCVHVLEGAPNTITEIFQLTNSSAPVSPTYTTGGKW